jgi:hypothetical protein
MFTKGFGIAAFLECGIVGHVLAAEYYFALVWSDFACDEVEGSCLPCAIGADDSQDFARLHFKAEIVNGRHFAKRLV